MSQLNHSKTNVSSRSNSVKSQQSKFSNSSLNSSRRLKKVEQKDAIVELSNNIENFLWEGNHENYNTVVNTVNNKYVPFIWL